MSKEKFAVPRINDYAEPMIKIAQLLKKMEDQLTKEDYGLVLQNIKVIRKELDQLELYCYGAN